MALGGDGECLVATARGCPGTVGALHLIGGGLVQNPGIDGNDCHMWPVVVCMCRVVRFSLARLKIRFESSAFLGYWNCLPTVLHRVKRETWGYDNIDVLCLNKCLHHAWYWIVAHLEWLSQPLMWKLKLESKDSLLVAFQQNKLLSQKPCMSRSRLSIYH